MMYILWIVLYLLVGALALYFAKSWPQHWLTAVEEGKVKMPTGFPLSLILVCLYVVFIGYLILWPIAVIVAIKDNRKNASSSS